MKPDATQPDGGITSRGGMAFFWVLNNQCEHASLNRQLMAFQQAGVEALVLHPRGGLLVPYGGGDWFDLIRWLVGRCRNLGIEPILYDEDPYPSGNAGGRIAAENPEFVGYEITRHTASVELREGGLFLFPTGRLCWAGIVFPDDPERKPVDLTTRVGMIRRHWEKAEWDSRFYYPATPLYACPRAMAHHAEFGCKVPEIPKGGRLEAFVAHPAVAETEWGSMVDSLNPRATAEFLRLTHEGYKKTLGPELGATVRTIFTDEAKPHAERPWTPGIFESFEAAFGYDLRPELNRLFASDSCPRAMKVRLDYRKWVMERFHRAWMLPVSRWCRRNSLSLIGHFSPEEDPANQSTTIGNVMPLQRHLALSGFDLIIPAVGDSRHPLLNIAAVGAASSAQQNRQPGVCCESLGAFGHDVEPRTLAKVLAWQAVHGVTLAVIHAAYHSQLGLRGYDAPPDYGPDSPLWDSMVGILGELAPFFRETAGATQIAPVAILWPIRSFQARGYDWQDPDHKPRNEFLRLVSLCLENQIGIQFVDEADLVKAKVKKGGFRIGRASFRHLLIPPVEVIDAGTIEFIETLRRAGIPITGVGKAPRHAYDAGKRFLVKPGVCWESESFTSWIRGTLPGLPRLVRLSGKGLSEFRVTAWRKNKRETLLVMNLHSKERRIGVGGSEIRFGGGELVRFSRDGGGWRMVDRFSPSSFAAKPLNGAAGDFGEWEMRVGNGLPIRASHPMGAWQLAPGPDGGSIPMVLTRDMPLGKEQIADSITYRTRLSLPSGARTASLLVEPTLMRGRFTLSAGKKSWCFRVADTDTKALKIPLPTPNGSGGMLLTFILHNPEASDGIKHHPAVQLTMK